MFKSHCKPLTSSTYHPLTDSIVRTVMSPFRLRKREYPQVNDSLRVCCMKLLNDFPYHPFIVRIFTFSWLIFIVGTYTMDAMGFQIR